MKTTNLIPNYPQPSLPEHANERIEIGKGDKNYWRCNAIQFSPDGTQLAVAINSWTQTSTINEIRIYDVGTSEVRSVSIRPNEGQSSIAFSPDGKLLASGGDNNAVHLWDVFAGTAFITLTGHTHRVNDVAFSTDGHTVASGSQDGTIRLWDITTGSHKEFKLSGPVTSVAYSLDGKIFAAGAICFRQWVNFYTIYLWDAVDHTFLGSRKVHVGGNWISRATFSPDIKTLATQVEGPMIFLWDIKSGGYKDEIAGPRCQYACFPTCVVFSPDGKTLASGGGEYPCTTYNPLEQSSDNSVYLWDVVRNEFKYRFIGHTENVDSMVFSPDGKTLASVGKGQDSSVLLWNVDIPIGQVSIEQSVATPNITISESNKDIATKDDAEFQKRSFQIKQICKDRNITTLVHFSKLEYLRSILEEGLLDRSILETRAEVSFNDPNRWDRQKNAICLNISFPNYKLFSKFSRPSENSNPDYSKWIVLLLKAAVLWELDCAFCKENAAANNVSKIPIEERKQPNALEGLFDEYYTDNKGDSYNRHSSQLPEHFTTHPQAEVLVFDRIRTEYIQEIHFINETAWNQWRSINTGDYSPRFCVNDQYFQFGRDKIIQHHENLNNDDIPF